MTDTLSRHTGGSLSPALRYQDLPSGLSRAAQERFAQEGLFGYLSQPLIDSLARLCEGKNVLECYAGRGHLSALLAEKGISVRATSLQQGHDRSATLGHVFDVEDLSVAKAIDRYREWMDVLLVCWPTTVPDLALSLPLLPKDTPIVFIGEVTDYACNPPFLGGCATDEFFDMVDEIPATEHGLCYPTFRVDKIKVYQRRDFDQEPNPWKP